MAMTPGALTVPSPMPRHAFVCEHVRRLAEMLGYVTETFNPNKTPGHDLLVRSPSGQRLVIEVEDAYAQGQDPKWQQRCKELQQTGGPTAMIVIGPSSHYGEFVGKWSTWGGKGCGQDLFVIHDDSWQHVLPALLTHFL